MNKKILVTVLVMFLAGGVLAANELSDIQGIDLPTSIVAGREFVANFSFDYDSFIGDNGDNPSEFILQLNFTSENTTYPVWKGDFEVGGYMKKCLISYRESCWLESHKKIYFDCSEDESQTISFAEGQENVVAPNGTFYCYTEEGNLKLDEHDNVFLEIKSNMAIFPGEYNLIASLYYLNDTYAPIVEIMNKADFEKYYRENDKVSVVVNVNDSSPVSQIYGIADLINGNINFVNKYYEDGFYHFQEETPSDILEDDYNLTFYAMDESGNTGNDSVILKIDLTGPKITLLEPTSGVYSEIVPFKFRVVDEKAGVDDSSVEIRLREYIDGFGLCPTTGRSIGGINCTTTSWINLENSTNLDEYEIELNTSEYGLSSNEYWIDVRAKDILGNEMFWIEDD